MSDNEGSKWIQDAKKDEGKIRMFEVLEGFAPALFQVSRVSNYGFHKHTERARARLVQQQNLSYEEASKAVPYNNWLNGTIETYDNALLRHIIARMLGEIHAEDSELLHRAHEAWNSLAALTLYIKENERKLGEVVPVDSAPSS